jgi:hypothetical protein
MLSKYSLESTRLMAMLKARRSRGSDGDDGATCGRAEAVVLCIQARRSRSSDHLLRGIDRCLDLGELRHHLAPFYSHTGRPSIDPELMVRMLIVGYSFGIRSENLRRMAKRLFSAEPEVTSMAM